MTNVFPDDLCFTCGHSRSFHTSILPVCTFVTNIPVIHQTFRCRCPSFVPPITFDIPTEITNHKLPTLISSPSPDYTVNRALNDLRDRARDRNLLGFVSPDDDSNHLSKVSHVVLNFTIRHVVSDPDLGYLWVTIQPISTPPGRALRAALVANPNAFIAYPLFFSSNHDIRYLKGVGLRRLKETDDD